MALDMGEAAKVFAIGAAVGGLGYFILSKANIQIGLPGAPTTAAPMMPPATGTGGAGGTPQVPMQMPATTMMASAYPAFGYDINGDDQWNNSEVWDTRNRKYFSDNILFNKLPYIPLTLKSDFQPDVRLPFSQAYGQNMDHDSPRPRFGTHALDREIADEFYPRKTPLPHYF